MNTDTVFIYIGAFVFLVGIIMLYIARRKDANNWIIQKATPMPLSLVNVRDDVWISGRAAADNPLVIPHFAKSAIYYSYKFEKHVMKTRTHRDSKGNLRTETYYEWETRDQKEEGINFQIADRNLAIKVRISEAKLDDLYNTGYAYEGTDRRYSARYLPCPCGVSAVGSVSEKKEYLEPYENIPLVVTTRPRKEYVDGLEKSEKLLRIFGNVALLGGIFMIFYALGAQVLQGHASQTQRLIASGTLALLIFLSMWTTQIYNMLASYRIRVQNAWAQIEVDIKNRFDLIPNLVEVVKGLTSHEKELFEDIAKKRSDYLNQGMRDRVNTAGSLEGQFHRLVVVVEKYPELKSNESYLYLHKQLVALEEKISYGRTFFNEAVTEYNRLVETIPHTLVAKLFRFRSSPFLNSAGDA